MPTTTRTATARRSRSKSTASETRRPAPTPLDVAARMLARAPRTEAELEERLVALGYRRETAAATVARCRELDRLASSRLCNVCGRPSSAALWKGDHRQMTELPIWLRIVIQAAAGLAVAFLLLPVLAVVPASVNASTFIYLPPRGVSLHWYTEFATSPEWRSAFLMSLEVGAAATAIALILLLQGMQFSMLGFNLPFNMCVP